MIVSVPNASPAMPGISPPGQTVAEMVSNGAPASTADSTSPPQVTFAGTLQSRLTAMTLNKTAVLPAIFAAAAAKQALPPDLTVAFAALAKQSALMAAGVVPSNVGKVAHSEIVSVTSNAPDEAGTPPETVSIEPSLPYPATPVPIALNVVIPPAPMALPQRPTAPAVAPGSIANQPQEAVAVAINNSVLGKTIGQSAEQIPAAVLAATPEKTALATATPGRNTGDTAFSEILRNSIPQTIPTSGNPMQPQALQAGGGNFAVREVASPVTSAQWAGDVGNQLSWMVSKRESHADLVLNPPHLGRIEVSITLNGDKASASFVSGNPEVRDALQGSLPRLREVLADAGVFLGQANIGAESFRHGENGAEKGAKSFDDSPPLTGQSLLGSEAGSLSMASSQQAGSGWGLIDLFA